MTLGDGFLPERNWRRGRKSCAVHTGQPARLGATRHAQVRVCLLSGLVVSMVVASDRLSADPRPRAGTAQSPTGEPGTQPFLMG